MRVQASATEMLCKTAIHWLSEILVFGISMSPRRRQTPRLRKRAYPGSVRVLFTKMERQGSGVIYIECRSRKQVAVENGAWFTRVGH
jgi:hypothetical protein